MLLIRFIFLATCGGFVVLAAMICTLLPLGIALDRAVGLFRRQSRAWPPTEQHSWGAFLQTFGVCIGYPLFFAEFSHRFVATAQVKPPWPYALAGLLVMFCFLAASLGRLSAKEAQSGAAYGVWAALALYSCLYFYPVLLERIPGGAAIFTSMLYLVQWSLSLWLTRILTYGIAAGFILLFTGLAVYWTLKLLGLLLSPLSPRRS